MFMKRRSGALARARAYYLTLLILLLILTLTILGTEMVNVFGNNILLLCDLCIIASLPFLGVGGFIPKKLFPLVLFVASLALLYQTSLISDRLIGPDINQEYYLANLVKTSSRWDSSIPIDYNSMLSVVILAPVLSTTSGMSLIWVFKIIYPLLFSLVPLVLFQISQKHIGEKAAFLSTFFLVSIVTFYTEMISLARQEIAEIFFVLIIFVVVGIPNSGTKRTVLLVVLMASLIFSHYGLAFLLISGLLAAALVLPFITRIYKRSRCAEKVKENLYELSKSKRIIVMPVFILFSYLLMLAWYTYTSGSSTLAEIVNVNYRIVNSLFTEFLNPGAAQGLSQILTPTPSLLHETSKVFQLLMQLLVVVGLFSYLRNLGKQTSGKIIKMDYNNEYTSLSVVFLLLLFASIAVPFLASALNTTRLYHIALLLLAPFMVIGGVALFKLVFPSNLHFRRHLLSGDTSLKILSVILAFFLLFNTGFIYEISKDHPGSVSLSQNWILQHGSASEKIQFYNVYTPSEEVSSANWLSRYRNSTSPVYSDYRARNNALNAYAMLSRSDVRLMYNTLTLISDNSYVYLRKLNIVDGVMGGAPETDSSSQWFNSTSIISLVSQKADKIYSNGRSDLYLTVETIDLAP